MLTISLVPAATAAAANPPVMATNYDQTVYGDFEVTGNSVTRCPQEPGHHPVKLCLDAQNRIGFGVTAQNNGYPMAWADVDKDPATYNSSTARLVIPAGARIAYAKLSWAGDTGGPAGVPCGHGMPKPPGSPRQQAVTMTVNDRSSSVRPGRYTEDALSELGQTDHQFYSAATDVTGSFAGVLGPATVTVGNVWTPQGYDCFGGWSLVAVWAFDGPTSQFAPARKQVAVYDGHVRVFSGRFRADTRMPSIKAAGGASRVGVTAYEGDWAVSGDQFLLNGRNAGGGENFFTSTADGQVNPNHVNNMSVDARTVDTELLQTGDTGANVTFTSGLDAYLVAGLAASSARPELILSTSVDRGVAHPGDDVTQSVVVTNTGGAPAVDVRVREDLGPACDQMIGQLDAGKSITVRCTRAAREEDYRPTATVTGQSLVGDKLSAQASAVVEVIRPVIAVAKSASPAVVLNGQSVGYEIEVRNVGDTPLSGVSIDDKQVDACDNPKVGVLAVGESRKVLCSVVAGDDGFANTVTVAATDKLGKQVAAEARAAFSVVHPKIDFSVTPSTHAVRAGEVVTFTIRVANPSKVPLSDVRVEGTPSVCERVIGDLPAGQYAVYTCSVTAGERLTTALSVTGTPKVNGQVRLDSVHSSASAIVSLVSSEVPPPVIAVPVARKAVAAPVPDRIPVAILIAGLGALTSFVTIGAISATMGRPGK